MNIESSSVSLTTKDGKTFACRMSPDVVTLADDHNTAQIPHDVFRHFYHLFSICTGQDKDAIKQLKKDNLRDTIAPEITEITGGVGEIGSHEAITQLVAQPMFADKARPDGTALTSFRQKVESLFECPVTQGPYQIQLIRKKVPGAKARKWFEVRLNSNGDTTYG